MHRGQGLPYLAGSLCHARVVPVAGPGRHSRRTWADKGLRGPSPVYPQACAAPVWTAPGMAPPGLPILRQCDRRQANQPLASAGHGLSTSLSSPEWISAHFNPAGVATRWAGRRRAPGQTVAQAGPGPPPRLDDQLCFAVYSTMLGLNKIYRHGSSRWNRPTLSTWWILVLWGRHGLTARRPGSGCSWFSPLTMRSRLLLPHPLAPTRARVSPWCHPPDRQGAPAGRAGQSHSARVGRGGRLFAGRGVAAAGAWCSCAMPWRWPLRAGQQWKARSDGHGHLGHRPGRGPAGGGQLAAT
jgi:hypothetical protein